MTVLVVILLELLSVNFNCFYWILLFNYCSNGLKDWMFIMLTNFLNHLFLLLLILLIICTFLNLVCHLFSQFVIWNKIRQLFLGDLFADLNSSFSFSEIFWIIDIEYFAQKSSIRCDECVVKFIRCIYFCDWRGWAFWQFPERFTIFCLCV